MIPEFNATFNNQRKMCYCSCITYLIIINVITFFLNTFKQEALKIFQFFNILDENYHVFRRRDEEIFIHNWSFSDSTFECTSDLKLSKISKDFKDFLEISKRSQKIAQLIRIFLFLLNKNLKFLKLKFFFSKIFCRFDL